MGFSVEWPIELMHRVSFLTMHGWVYENRYQISRAPRVDPKGEGWYKDGFKHLILIDGETVESICFPHTDDAYWAQLDAAEPSIKK